MYQEYENVNDFYNDFDDEGFMTPPISGESRYVPTTLKEKIIGKLDEWFWRIEDDSAKNYFPSPECTISQDDADKLIEVIDNFIEDEINSHQMYWASLGISEYADFNRLPPPARIALAEDMQRIFREENKDLELI